MRQAPELQAALAALEARDLAAASLDAVFDRKLRDARQAGYTIDAIAHAVGLSTTGVHKALRRDAAEPSYIDARARVTITPTKGTP